MPLLAQMIVVFIELLACWWLRSGPSLCVVDICNVTLWNTNILFFMSLLTMLMSYMTKI